MVRRPSKAPLGSSDRKVGTRDIHLGAGKEVPNLIVISFQYFIDQDTEYCQSLKKKKKLEIFLHLQIEEL